MKKEKRYELNRPFLQIVRKGEDTFLRVRQATTLGYTDCPLDGAVDLSYPTSPYRRARTIGGGKLANTITSSNNGIVIFKKIKYDSTD